MLCRAGDDCTAEPSPNRVGATSGYRLALVLRAHETLGRPADARIELPRWEIGFDASFGPSELKTFRIEPDGRVTETDLLEGLEAEPA